MKLTKTTSGLDELHAPTTSTDRRLMYYISLLGFCDIFNYDLEKPCASPFYASFVLALVIMGVFVWSVFE